MDTPSNGSARYGSSGYKIGAIALAGNAIFSLVPARSTDGLYRFQLGGIWFEWNDVAAQIAKFRAGMNDAMTEFATPSTRQSHEK